MEPRIKQGACCIPATVAIQATGDTSSLAFPHTPTPPFRPPPFPRQETTLRPPSSSSSIPIPPRHDRKPTSTRPVGSASPACNSFLRWACLVRAPAAEAGAEMTMPGSSARPSFSAFRGARWRADLGVIPGSAAVSTDDLRRAAADSRRRSDRLGESCCVSPCRSFLHFLQ